MRERVRGGEHAAPAVAEEGEAAGAQAERVHEVVEFADEEGRRPEGGVALACGQVRGVAVAELVVEDGRRRVLGGEVG